jgi:ferritin-like metal-binding protein YciE
VKSFPGNQNSLENLYFDRLNQWHGGKNVKKCKAVAALSAEGNEVIGILMKESTTAAGRHAEIASHEMLRTFAVIQGSESQAAVLDQAMQEENPNSFLLAIRDVATVEDRKAA